MLVASREIDKGEWLWLDYDQEPIIEYREGVEETLPVCRCNSLVCRGEVGGMPDEPIDVSRRAVPTRSVLCLVTRENKE
jgi:hypothetical protein